MVCHFHSKRECLCDSEEDCTISSAKAINTRLYAALAARRRQRRITLLMTALVTGASIGLLFYAALAIANERIHHLAQQETHHG